ncbi:Major facilitator superfamily [Seminavis robusta]|uniref:Major facilitator superfamily n=1 Tax=Seminavis robusta TaxID=568900 RepID=A0A9N8DUZ0_9STRA|nr:Major facilitator superfamily [Seminavis robusta]|eukprot:Sro361_g126660.1 Major facilitator superfamily (567) ;mRNA; r:64535-66235
MATPSSSPSSSSLGRRPARMTFEKADEGLPPPPAVVLREEHPNPMADEVTLRRLSNIPRLFRYEDDKPPEATGLAMDVFARATILMSSIFLGPALLELAAQAVEENCDSTYAKQEEVECCMEDGRIYGFRPSSLLSNIAVVSGVLVSLAMPLCGALVDHTPHRWLAGAASAAGLVVVMATETMVSSKTWFAVACLQVIKSLFYNGHLTVTLSYTSDLTTDAAQQTAYNTYFVVVLYIATLLFLVWVTVMSYVLNQDDVGTARISQVTTTCTSGTVFYFGWKWFFRQREALSVVPEGMTLLSVGFRKVGRTFARIVRELPALKWMIFAVMFGEAATGTLITVATTYMKQFLQMDSSEIGLTFLAVLIMGGPGSRLGGWIALKFNPIISAAICNIVFILVTTLAALTLNGPDKKAYMPIPGLIWGLCLGWLLPMHSTAFITIVPRGQEAEMMGLYILAGQSLSWLPPMVFTALNEAGVDMAVGLASLDIFFFCATLCLIMVLVANKNRKSLVDPIETAYERQPTYDSTATLPSTTSSLEPGVVVEMHDMEPQGMQHRNRNGYSLPSMT